MSEEPNTSPPPSQCEEPCDIELISKALDKAVIMAVRSIDRPWQMLNANGNPDLRHSPEANSVTNCVEQYSGTAEADDYGRLIATFSDSEMALQCALALRELVRTTSPDGSETSLCFGIAAEISGADSDKINEGAIAAVSLAGSAKPGQIIFSRGACESLSAENTDCFVPFGAVRFQDFSGSVEALQWQTAEAKTIPPAKADTRVLETSAQRVLPMFLTAIGTLVAAAIMVVGGLSMLNEPSHAQISLPASQQGKATVTGKSAAAIEIVVGDSTPTELNMGDDQGASDALAPSTMIIRNSAILRDPSAEHSAPPIRRPVVAAMLTQVSSDLEPTEKPAPQPAQNPAAPQSIEQKPAPQGVATSAQVSSDPKLTGNGAEKPIQKSETSQNIAKNREAEAAAAATQGSSDTESANKGSQPIQNSVAQQNVKKSAGPRSKAQLRSDRSVRYQQDRAIAHLDYNQNRLAPHLRTAYWQDRIPKGVRNQILAYIGSH